MAATGDSPFTRKLAKDQRVEHALNRLAFGPRPGDVERVRKMGLEQWIDQQLHPERIAPNPVLAGRLKPLETLSLSIGQVAERYPLKTAAKTEQTKTLRDVLSPDELRKLRQGTPAEKFALIESLDPDRRKAAIEAMPPQIRRLLGMQVGAVAGDLMQAKIYRALYSERQLEEVLADFWFNHFNVYLNKGPERLMVGAYERDAIRPYVLGKFGDMLLATAKHPAMLFYLDNWRSRQRGLNENYARELMELHTIGVDGGYTQQDVIEVARCFTGWTLRQPRLGAAYLFAPRLHDRGEKAVLGHKIAAGRGEEDGLEVISILVHHPSTAQFISRKLAQRFVADQPPQALSDRMAATFTRTGGDLREVMKTMIASPEFFSQGAHRAKLKSPFEMVISAARALDAEVTNALPLSARLEELGQPLYRKEEPTGYYNTADEWTNSAGLLGRMNFATALAANQIPGAKVSSSRSGLSLAAPEFQRR
jgi:uncharacterized protein (DUF1800 family)